MTTRYEDGKLERICSICCKHMPIERGGQAFLYRAELPDKSPMSWDLCNSCIYQLLLWMQDERRIKGPKLDFGFTIDKKGEDDG